MGEIRDISRAAEPLQQFWTELQVLEPPFPVLYYQLGETYRGQAEQEAALARGASAAGWLSSPHNFEPSRALDVYPIIPTDRGPEVSNDPAHYAQIVELADNQFLISGASFNDYPHVQLPDWRNYSAPIAKKKSLLPWALLALAASAAIAWMNRK